MSVSISDSVFFLISLNRREAILLPSLQQGFCRQVQSQGSPTDPFGCEKIPMQELLQNLLQDVSSAQAWGIWLLCSTLNWDTFPRTDKKKEKKKKLWCFFIFPKPRRTVRESHRGGLFPKTFFFFSSSSTSGQFHFRVRNSSVLTCFSSQAVFSVIAISAELCHTMYSPTCAIHALFCMSRMFYMPSQCYLQCLYQCLSMAVNDSPPLF